MAFENDDLRPYLVLINEEGQHSIWPQRLAVPAGWSVVGAAGTREECVAWVDANWADMRPASLASAMDGAA